MGVVLPRCTLNEASTQPLSLKFRVRAGGGLGGNTDAEQQGEGDGFFHEYVLSG